jgi:8-hydroxy-5-deazaflavin:NADPH oxidoreductase
LVVEQKPQSNEGGSPIERIGFVGIDLGLLAVGGKVAQFRGGPLPNQNLVKVG